MREQKVLHLSEHFSAGTEVCQCSRGLKIPGERFKRATCAVTEPENVEMSLFLK